MQNSLATYLVGVSLVVIVLLPSLSRWLSTAQHAAHLDATAETANRVMPPAEGYTDPASMTTSPNPSASNVPSPDSNTLSHGDTPIAKRRNQLAQEVEAAQASLTSLNREVEAAKSTIVTNRSGAQMLQFIVQRKLDPTKFARRFIIGATVYQILVSSGGDRNRIAMLQTYDTEFTSTGTTSMYVKYVDALSVTTDDGFDHEIPVYEELSQQEEAALNTREAKMGELSGRLATAHQAVDAALQRQRIFEYAAKKFSEVHLAPVCHVSRRLQELGFTAQVASVQWDRVVGLITQADWQGLAEEVGGKNGNMVSESDVNTTFDRLEKLSVRMEIKSPRSHLYVITGGGGGSYLEPPKQHRVVAVASLSLPVNPGDLYSSMAYNRVDLGTIPDLINLRQNPLPDQNGYAATWIPADTDLYFCVDVWFGDEGERSVSSEFDELRRAIAKECKEIKSRSNPEKHYSGETAGEISRSLNRIYDYAIGPLMSDF